jgi:hypothetical protein
MSPLGLHLGHHKSLFHHINTLTTILVQRKQNWTIDRAVYLRRICSSGFEFNPPYSTSSSQIQFTAYVDNVNMHHTFPSKSTISTMIQKPSISAQQWQDLLYISGGQLSSTKCNFYAVTWEARHKF